MLLIYRKPDITNLQPVRPSPIVSAAFTPHSVRQADVFQPISLMSGPALGEHPHAPPIPPVVLVTNINEVFALFPVIIEETQRFPDR